MKIIMTKGLPASGKTTWAKQFIAERTTDYGEKWKRINKDDMRAMLDNGVWNRENEHFVLLMRDTAILSALDHGFNVVVDDTNFAPKHETTLKEIAKLKKADFEIKDFTTVSLYECIKRDLQRANSVGQKVITRMYQQYLSPLTRAYYLWNKDLPFAVLCDLDGTLALFEGNPYKRDFLKDRGNKPVIEAVRAMKNAGFPIIITSGRKAEFMADTKEWLKNQDIPYNDILMRSTGDNRPDFVVKQEMFHFIASGYNILFVFDDRNQVVEMWRNNGVTCFQVAEGDF